jgi:Ca2+-binding EF-hand superfamily protein
MDKKRRGKVTFKTLLRTMFPTATAYDLKTLYGMARPESRVLTKKKDQQLLNEVWTLFQLYDDNQTGTLDLEEFIAAMGSAGETAARCTAWVTLDSDRT